MAKRASNVRPIKRPETGPDLAWIADLPERSRPRVEALARHLHETAGHLTPPDVELLIEVGRTIEDIRVGDLFRQQAADADDADAWSTLSRKADQSRAALRSLLKDLRLSRAAATNNQGTAGARKIQERSGSSWQGLI